VDSRPFTLLQELAAREPVVLQLRGDCMMPLLQPGAAVTIRRRRFLFPGDVIVFRTAAGDLAAHRVLGFRRHRGRNCVVTQGDRCTIHDAPVEMDAIIGCVIDLDIPFRGRGSALLRYAMLGVRWSMRRITRRNTR
jgi:signal peptidase I